MTAALIQIVDEDDNPVGSDTKNNAWQRGLVHRVVRVMLEDNDGNVLLQKRAETQALYPGRWDNSAAGHVDAGEDYETAAKRELMEEIGIAGAEFKEMGYYRSHGVFEGRQLNRFVKAYEVVIPKRAAFTLQTEEVSEIKWFTPEEFNRLASRHPEQVSDGILEVYKRFYS